jgi:hypothetical protein
MSLFEPGRKISPDALAQAFDLRPVLPAEGLMQRWTQWMVLPGKSLPAE